MIKNGFLFIKKPSAFIREYPWLQTSYGCENL